MSNNYYNKLKKNKSKLKTKKNLKNKIKIGGVKTRNTTQNIEEEKNIYTQISKNESKLLKDKINKILNSLYETISIQNNFLKKDTLNTIIENIVNDIEKIFKDYNDNTNTNEIKLEIDSIITNITPEITYDKYIIYNIQYYTIKKYLENVNNNIFENLFNEIEPIEIILKLKDKTNCKKDNKITDENKKIEKKEKEKNKIICELIEYFLDIEQNLYSFSSKTPNKMKIKNIIYTIYNNIIKNKYDITVDKSFTTNASLEVKKGYNLSKKITGDIVLGSSKILENGVNALNNLIKSTPKKKTLKIRTGFITNLTNNKNISFPFLNIYTNTPSSSNEIDQMLAMILNGNKIPKENMYIHETDINENNKTNII